MPPARSLPRRPAVVHAVVAMLLAVSIVGSARAQAPTEAWLDLPLADAATGAVFTLRELGGSVVLVETMATWCANCARQLGQVREAAAFLGNEAASGVPLVVVAISVERGLAPAALAAYAARAGLEFRFVVADDALLRALADRFGRTVLNPASTPNLVIASDGTVGALSTGPTPAAGLVEKLQAAAR